MLVDGWAAEWRAAFDRFAISYDRFIRTTDPDHVRASLEMVRRAQENGDIYKGTYSGWYCIGDNEFKTDAQIVDGRCPDHPTLELQWLEEENYFFRLSAYQGRLEALYRDNPSFCEPEHFRREVLAWLREGLRDFSISRAGVEWGIPFPGDPDHRIYVWFDALTNYVTGAGFPDDPEAFARWWPADVHVIGMNITRFHCLYWPAMLMSAGIELPKQVFAHGFMTLRGEKMSKTRGNVRGSGGHDQPVRRGRDALPRPARDPVRPGRRHDRGRPGPALQRRAGARSGQPGQPDREHERRATWRVRCRRWMPRNQPTTSCGRPRRLPSSATTPPCSGLHFDEALAAVMSLTGAANGYAESQAPWTLNKLGETGAAGRRCWPSWPRRAASWVT